MTLKTKSFDIAKYLNTSEEIRDFLPGAALRAASENHLLGSVQRTNCFATTVASFVSGQWLLQSGISAGSGRVGDERYA